MPEHHLRRQSTIYDDTVVHNSSHLIICTAIVILGKKAGVHIVERGQFNDKSLDYISSRSDLYERTPTSFAYESNFIDCCYKYNKNLTQGKYMHEAYDT